MLDRSKKRFWATTGIINKLLKIIFNLTLLQLLPCWPDDRKGICPLTIPATAILNCVLSENSAESSLNCGVPGTFATETKADTWQMLHLPLLPTRGLRLCEWSCGAAVSRLTYPDMSRWCRTLSDAAHTQWLKWGGWGLSPPAPIWAPCNSMSPPDWIYKVLFYA